MDVISIRIDNNLSDKINRLASRQKVSKSEIIRIILKSGVQSLEIEKNYLGKIYNLSVQNWVFSKNLLEKLSSKEAYDEARLEAQKLLEQLDNGDGHEYSMERN
jgi:metal-responsive CopG/Arc/MetJ family transcriptional regulator